MTSTLSDWMWGGGVELEKLRKAVDNATRMKIIEKIHKQPRTVTQLAQDLCLSRTAIYSHIKDMKAKGVLKEVEPRVKRYRNEKYYALAVPVCKKEDLKRLRKTCEEIVEQYSEILLKYAKIRRKLWDEMEKTFQETEMGKNGWNIEDVWILAHTIVENTIASKMKEFEEVYSRVDSRTWGFMFVEIGEEDG